MNDAQHPDHESTSKSDQAAIHGADQPARSGTRAITGFAVAGVILAFGIGAWTWNNSATETTPTAGQTSAERSLATSDTAEVTETDSTATSSSTSNPPSETSTTVETETPQATAEANDQWLNEEPTPQDPSFSSGMDLAPLAAGDPYLPPDSWGGEAQENLPRETIVAEANPGEQAVEAEPTDTSATTTDKQTETEAEDSTDPQATESTDNQQPEQTQNPATDGVEPKEQDAPAPGEAPAPADAASPTTAEDTTGPATSDSVPDYTAPSKPSQIGKGLMDLMDTWK